MAYGKLAGSGMGWRAQGRSPHQCAPAPELATLLSPGDARGQAGSKFTLCHQGEGIVSSLSPQLSPWWHPGAPQGGQCCCALGFILGPYLPHYTLVPGYCTPVTVSSLSTQSSPCHCAVIRMASEGQWRSPYSLGGHGGLPAMGLVLPGHSRCATVSPRVVGSYQSKEGSTPGQGWLLP